MTIEKRLERIRGLQREKRHPLIQEIHEEEGLHKGTLFYVKEYGEGAIVWRTILRESLPVLLLASVISSVGGVTLESAKVTIFALTPFVLLLPALNDMIGDYGIIVSARLSEIFYRREIDESWWRDRDIRRLFRQVVVAAGITSVFSTALALGITHWGYGPVGAIFAIKVVGGVMLHTLILIFVVFVIAILAGLVTYRRGHDPNNFLIPITTAIADLLNIVLLTVLVTLLFQPT